MSVQQMLELGRAPVSKLIVGVGEVAKGAHRGLINVGFIVSSKMLDHCSAPLADIHDPSVAFGRSGYRDEFGYDRAEGDVISIGAHSPASNGKGAFTKIAAKGRGKAAWSHNAFKDFEGLYCDRLACGHPPERVAILQPHTGLDSIGRSIGLVMAAQRQLDAPDVLLLYPTTKVPFGGALINTLRGTERAGLIDPLTQSALVSANEALVTASSSGDGSSLDGEAGLDMCVLSIGIGGLGDAINTPMSPMVLATLKNLLAPKLAFASAYWCSTPAKAAQFLAKDIKSVPNIATSSKLELTTEAETELKAAAQAGPKTPHISSTASLVASTSGQTSASKASLYKSMQRPLLSTNNQTILSAYALGMSVSDRSTMHEAGTIAAAQRVLKDIQEQGYWRT